MYFIRHSSTLPAKDVIFEAGPHCFCPQMGNENRPFTQCQQKLPAGEKLIKPYDPTQKHAPLIGISSKPSRHMRYFSKHTSTQVIILCSIPTETNPPLHLPCVTPAHCLPLTLRTCEIN